MTIFIASRGTRGASTTRRDRATIRPVARTEPRPEASTAAPARSEPTAAPAKSQKPRGKATKPPKQ